MRTDATKQTEKNVECQDCGKQFTTLKDIPKCPRCGGTEVSYLFRPCS